MEVFYFVGDLICLPTCMVMIVKLFNDMFGE